MNEQPRILVVDENEDNCTMMATLLGHLGYATEAARSVTGALKQARDRQPALYVLDSYFSDGHGADLCRQLCASDPQATVVFYSCAFDRADFEAALRAGARAYVIKPDIDGLLETIATCLGPVGDGANRPTFVYN